MTTRKPTTALLACVAILAAGCGGDEGEPGHGEPYTPPATSAGLVLVPATQTTTPGSDVEVRLENRSGSRATYGACPVLERRSGDRFVPAISGPVACIEIAYVTPDGRTGAPLGVTVPDSAPPGEYRIRHEITLGTSEVEQVTVSASLTVGDA